MKVDRDLIIIGGGGAGLTAAQYGARANLNVLLIEEMAPGGQALIINDLENYPGFPDVISGFEFSEKMEKQARNFGSEFLAASVKKIIKKDKIFHVETTKGEFTCYTVILCTGAKHRELNIPGEKEYSGKGISYCATCDGPFFRGKKMFVVGGGDAACDEAMFLANLTDSIVHIHRRDKFRAQKSLADRVQRNKNIEVRFNTVMKEIKGDAKVEKVILENLETGEVYEEETDAVFIFVGSIPQTQLAAEMEKDDGGYIKTNQRMETGEPGFFVAGDVRATPFRQLVVAAGEGAIAAHSASQYIDELKGEAYN